MAAKDDVAEKAIMGRRAAARRAIIILNFLTVHAVLRKKDLYHQDAVAEVDWRLLIAIVFATAIFAFIGIGQNADHIDASFA